MTTPRVTVPVEDLIDIVEGIGGIQHGTWRDEHGMRLKDTPAWVAFYTAARLSAAPAPEGGAVDDLYERAKVFATRDKASTSYLQRRLQITFNQASSLIERMEGEGLVSKANAAGLRTILVPYAALATREEAPVELLSDPQQLEAPAEAGEGDKRAWIDRWNAIEAAARDALHTMNALLEAPNLKRMQYALGERRDTLRDALNLPEAGTAWMRPTALRAQPPAREDAQPVGWTGSGSIDALKAGLQGHMWPNKAPAHPVALYTHPAPDALRVAVEEAAKAVVLAAWTDRLERLHGHPSVIALDQALAALQAEQKGGA